MEKSKLNKNGEFNYVLVICSFMKSILGIRFFFLFLNIFCFLSDVSNSKLVSLALKIL